MSAGGARAPRRTLTFFSDHAMRGSLMGIAVLPLASAPALAAAAAEGGAGGGLLSVNPGLMVWTFVIFFALLWVLSKIAYRPLLQAVQKREKALEDAIEGAKRDREEAQKAMEEQQRLIDEARAEAQKYIAEGRSAGEKLRTEMLEEARSQQQELLARARRDIESEKERAIAELRREAVDLALAAAGKVIEKDLDDASNRRLVESFLATIEPAKSGGVQAATKKGKRGAGR